MREAAASMLELVPPVELKLDAAVRADDFHDRRRAAARHAVRIGDALTRLSRP
jgi:hypothetical protein